MALTFRHLSVLQATQALRHRTDLMSSQSSHYTARYLRADLRHRSLSSVSFRKMNSNVSVELDPSELLRTLRSCSPTLLTQVYLGIEDQVTKIRQEPHNYKSRGRWP